MISKKLLAKLKPDSADYYLATQVLHAANRLNTITERRLHIPSKGNREDMIAAVLQIDSFLKLLKERVVPPSPVKEPVVLKD